MVGLDGVPLFLTPGPGIFELRLELLDQLSGGVDTGHQLIEAILVGLVTVICVAVVLLSDRLVAFPDLVLLGLYLGADLAYIPALTVLARSRLRGSLCLGNGLV